MQVELQTGDITEQRVDAIALGELRQRGPAAAASRTSSPGQPALAVRVAA